MPTTAKEPAEGPDVQDKPSGESLLIQEGDVAGDYLERLLDILDYDGDIDLDVEGGRAIVSIEGAEDDADLQKLVGDKGSVLESLQELARLAVQQQLGSRSRLMLDIAGYREQRRKELMPVLVWDEVGKRTYQTGVDRGVLYLFDKTVVAWNGLVDVEESPSSELKSFFLDGVKFLENLTPGDFIGKLKAFTYPDEFDSVNGIAHDVCCRRAVLHSDGDAAGSFGCLLQRSGYQPVDWCADALRAAGHRFSQPPNLGGDF